MDPIQVFLFVTITVLLVVLSYRVGKLEGRKETQQELVESFLNSVVGINEILDQTEEQRREYIYAVKKIDANKGKIPTKEVYNIIYKNNLVEGKVYCSCQNPDQCEVFALLREYRSSHKNQFTEEELNRNDGL